jgi:hypothetical protein
MGKVYPQAGHIIFEKSGRVVWSSALRPVNLLPDAYRIVLGNFDITYPDLHKNNAYGFDKGNDPITGFEETSCVSFASIVPGEWGPGRANDLPRQLLGNVPAGINYLEVQVALWRVFEPSAYLGLPIPKIIQEGQFILLDGGFAEVEGVGPFRRAFAVVQDGTGVYLERYQSALNPGNIGIWTPGNAVYYSSGAKREGWTHGGRPDALPAFMLDTKGPSGNVNKERGGSNACSLNDTSNYSSVWRGTIIVTPGYIHS